MLVLTATIVILIYLWQSQIYSKTDRSSGQVFKPTRVDHPEGSECSSSMLVVRSMLLQNFSVSCIYPVSFNDGSHSVSCASAMAIYGPKVAFKSSLWVPGK